MFCSSSSGIGEATDHRRGGGVLFGKHETGQRK
jgi:hypothetical protein